MGAELGSEHCGDTVRNRPYEAEKALGLELGTWCPSNSHYFCHRMEGEWGAYKRAVDFLPVFTTYTETSNEDKQQPSQLMKNSPDARYTKRNQ